MLRRLITGALAVGAIAVVSWLAAGCQIPGAVLKGQLTLTADGSHPAGVAVTVYSNTSQTVVAQTITDSNGDYSFVSSALPDGTYRVRFSSTDWWNHVSGWTGATSVTVAAAAPVTINETLTPTVGSVTGTVTDGTNPIPGAAVAAIDTGGITVATTTTATDGTYGFASLPDGSYVFKFTASGYTTRYNGSSDVQQGAPSVVVDANDPKTGIDTTLAPQATIVGTVTNGSTPLAGIVVAAFDHTNGAIDAAVTTGADGTFTLGGLDAHTYTIMLADTAHAMRTQVWGSVSQTDPSTGTLVTPAAGAADPVGTITLVGKDCHLDGTPYATDLANANLTNCNLTGTDLSGADLVDATLVNTNLGAVNLTGAELTNAELTGANLANADLTGTTLAGVASGGILGAPTVMPANWTLIEGYLIGPGGNLTGANLTGASLIGCDFADADLTGANLFGTDLTGATSGGTTGIPSSLPASWTLIDGYLIGPGANLTGAGLAHTNLEGVTFIGATLAGADFADADLTGANLTSTNLANADLDGADLTGAALNGVISGGITGTPAALPSGWTLVGGFLIPPS